MQTIEGVWGSETAMGEHEGGECRLTIDASTLEMACSPGARRERYSYRITSKQPSGVVLDVYSAGPGGAPTRLRIEVMRSEEGRALRITDLARPGAAPLGAYGHPERWSSVAPLGPE